MTLGLKFRGMGGVGGSPTREREVMREKKSRRNNGGGERTLSDDDDVEPKKECSVICVTVLIKPRG